MSPSIEKNEKKLVLYIEDDLSCQMLIKNVLKRRPEISPVFTGLAQTGIELAYSRRPDLILLDIKLPDQDGYWVLDQLKTHEETRNIPVISISASAMPDDIKKGIAKGISYYLTKPFSVFELLDLVDSILHK